MTPQEIRSAILASTDLRQAIERGDDEYVAKELRRLQPKERKVLRLNELQLLELYTTARYGDAITVINAFRTSTIPLAVLVTRFMQPESTTTPDFGSAGIRGLLTDAAPAGFGLSNSVCRPILDATLEDTRVTTQEVSVAVLAWRSGGRIGPIPGGAT